MAGTVWHGLLENDEFRRAYLQEVAGRAGRDFTAASTSFEAVRQARLDRLAGLVAGHLDTAAVRELIDRGPGRPATVTMTLGPPAGRPPAPDQAAPEPVKAGAAGRARQAAPGPAGTGTPALPRRTGRLVLRPFLAGDEQDVLAYRGRPDVVRFMPAGPLTPGAAAAWVAERATATAILADDGLLALAAEHDGSVIGEVLIRAGKLADRQAEIGWAFHPGYHGRGLATEAARELLAMAFADLGMHRAWARLDPRNTASARVCERIGLRLEGHLRQSARLKGEWCDVAIYAMLASEWRG